MTDDDKTVLKRQGIILTYWWFPVFLSTVGMLDII